MTFKDRFSQPRDGHELVAVGREEGMFWCLRCGVLRVEPRPGLREHATWEVPGQAGRSHTTTGAPPCLPSTEAGANNTAGDARLMLLALTHAWRCEPILLSSRERAEAWRWSCDGPLGGESWSIAGAWADGPVVDETVRDKLLVHLRGA